MKNEYKSNYAFNEALVGQYLVKKVGDDMATTLLDAAKGQPDMFRWLAKEAQVMNEAGSFGNVSPGDFGGLTYESAQAKIREVLSVPRDQQKDHPYHSERHPKHWEAVKEMENWYKVKKPASAA